MNGSRSNTSRHSDRTSLDALNRTIEGLEARIEGLMGSGREQRPRDPAPERERERDPYSNSYAPRAADPLAEIRQRQRALEASRENRDRAYTREPAPALMREPVSTHLREPAPSHLREPAPQRAPAQQPAAAAFRASDETMTEIAQALVNLRQDLKRDISEGVTREMNALRSELREIKVSAQDKHFADDIRADMGRLSQSIAQLTSRSVGPEAAGLRNDFEELRSLMDGLAREDSVRHMEQRWDNVEGRLAELDTAGLQEELVSLAYRLDDIKRHLGGMGESPAVRALEDKLITIASAIEQFGNMIQPHDRIMSEQFAAMDGRLDEISRAIAASGRTAAANSDPALMQRLENRLSALGEQIELMGRAAMSRPNPADEMAGRLEALTARVEDLAKTEATSRLDERLEHLSYLLERTHKAAPQPDLTGALSDISRKIDALENGSVNEALGKRLDYLARRIDEMEVRPIPAPVIDDSAFRRIEGRLGDIAARLEESTAAAPTDTQALKNLEEQIANLSELLNAPREHSEVSVDLDRRMGAIEDYIATNDEYIIEAARQAAEAVVDAYSRNGGAQGAAPAPADMSALVALADDLRHLEDLSRDSEERTHKTFQALHETLVHIADRLDSMEDRVRPSVRMPAAETEFDFDPYALVDAGRAPEPVKAPVMQAPPIQAPKASPVLRTADIAEEPVSRTPELALADSTSALAIEATGQQEKPALAAKGSLLANLGRKLMPSRKSEAKVTERTVIDPAPSIDPVDVVPAEAANELLEPGSGAPDVKKILERVRASQNAQRGKPVAENDRADYIAAARRAAQAAAMEIDGNAKPATRAERRAAKPENAGKGGAFARFRRPILLAVGAVLLAIMAFPLARTLTSGHKAPPPAEISALTGATEAPQANLVAPATVMPEATAPTSEMAAQPSTVAPVPEAVPPQAASAPEPQAAAPEHLTDATPLDGEGAETFGQAPAQDTSGFVANAPSTPAAAPIAPVTPSVIVPDTVQPQPLAEAARNGDALALFEIGARYTEGRNGLSADQKQAANWYQLSADKGFAPAQYRLGSMYEKGNGVDRDVQKAKGLYEQAANQGNASAMHNLAVLYASGALGQQDYATAASWFQKAADLGITDSQFNLAILCARGNGVPADLQESYKWFAIAAKAGDKDAAQKRDEVANAMKPDQLERARAKADLWKPQPLDNKANGIEIPDAWASGAAPKTASVDMKKAIRNIQAILNNNGFDAGAPDGEMGAKTVTAIKNFQKSIGQEPTGKVNDDTVKALLERNKPGAKAI